MDVYLGLFISAFLSATLLPGTSEIAIVALMQQHYDTGYLLVVATIGNTLGSIVNYVMGRYLLHFQEKSWFPFKKDSLEKSQKWFQQYGFWSMLLAWLPIIGDGLTFIAGTMKMNLIWFLVLVVIGKGFRYAVILGLFHFIV